MKTNKTKNQQGVNTPVVMHCVYIVVHKERLIIHGVFSKEEDATKYINGSETFGIIKCDVI